MNASRWFKCLSVLIALGVTTFLSMSAFSVKSDLPSDPHEEETVATAPTSTIVVAGTSNGGGSTITLQTLSSSVDEEDPSGGSESVATHSSTDGGGSVVAGSGGQSDRHRNVRQPHTTGVGGIGGNSGGAMPLGNSTDAGGNQSAGPNSDSTSGPNSNPVFGSSGSGPKRPSGQTIGGGGGAPLTDGSKGAVNPEESSAEDSNKPGDGPAIEDEAPDLGVSDIDNPSLTDPIADFDEGLMPIDLAEQFEAIAPTSDDKREASVVPEPGTLALLGFGLLSLVAMGRRRRRNS